MAFIPSPQQQAFFDWMTKSTGSAFVEAVAGAGKTTTLVNGLGLTRGYVSFAAYNKKIADEIKVKVARLNLGSRVQVGTFHSFGFRAWRRQHDKVQVAQGYDKTERMVQEFQIEKSLQTFVPKLISLAKQGGVGFIWQIEDDSHWYSIIDHFDLMQDIETENPEQTEQLLKRALDFAKRGVRWHAEIGPELIDFDDMIWLPCYAGLKLFQVDWVFVDEAQDTNPCRRALARKMLKPNGRAVFVGDRCQGIFGFTGADSDAIDQIIRDFRCTTLPLTVTYRCPQAVVAEARTIVSHITAHATAPQGKISTVGQAEFMKSAAQLTPADAILCRNTRPLVETAFALIKRGIACHVEGRDIGMGLLKLVNRFDARNIDDLLERLQAYADRQCEKLIAKGRETQAEALRDRVETIYVLAEGCKDADCVRTKISDMFQDSENERKPTLTLSTVHKAKGREWPRVFILGRNVYMPSKYARQAWQQEQERHLEYVSITRAQNELIFINVEV